MPVKKKSKSTGKKKAKKSKKKSTEKPGDPFVEKEVLSPPKPRERVCIATYTAYYLKPCSV